MKEPVATPTAEATAGPAKIVERVGGAAATPAAAPTAGRNDRPRPNTPAATPSAAASRRSSGRDARADSAAATTAPPAANPGVAVAARAAMLVAVATDPQKAGRQPRLGGVEHDPGAAGQPATVAVKAEADIPDLKTARGR